MSSTAAPKQGNKKVGRLYSSDFGGLANQLTLPFLEKVGGWPKTVKPRFQCQNRDKKTPLSKGLCPFCSIPFAICRPLFQAGRMTQPLALVLYEKLLPGSQLVNRLQDMNYRVQAIADAGRLAECAEQSRPMLVLADLASTRNDVCAALARLKQNSATKHLPVVAFSDEGSAELQAAAQAAGATLVVSEAAVLNHLPQILDQALQVE